jgi:hypothetical protein
MKNAAADARYAALSQVNPDSVHEQRKASVVNNKKISTGSHFSDYNPKQTNFSNNNLNNNHNSSSAVDENELAANLDGLVAANLFNPAHFIQLSNSNTNLSGSKDSNLHSHQRNNTVAFEHDGGININKYKNRNDPATAASGSKPPQQKSFKTKLERFKFLTRSNEDLIKLDTAEDSAERGEEARLAEEALAANLKLIKKQKAKFLRLQRILSRNVFIIPMCVVFTILSSLSIFGATLTDHFEYATYNITHLRRLIDAENNNSLALINSATGLRLTLEDIVSGRGRALLLAEVGRATSKMNGDVSDRRRTSSSQKRTTVITSPSTTPPVTSIDDASTPPLPKTTTYNFLSMLTERHQAIYFYELFNRNNMFYEVTKTSFLTHSVKNNVLYDTYSGIWRICNNLSSEYYRS